MKRTNLFAWSLTALLVAGLRLSGSAQTQAYGAQRLTAIGTASSYPTVVYKQSVVSNPSGAYQNVVNLHWRHGAGTAYVVLAGRYLSRSPYNGSYPTPIPPFSPPPAGTGNGRMDATSRLPGYAAGYEVAPFLIKTGSYAANPNDTTAQVLNALPGETYYAYIWEYTQNNGTLQVLSPPVNSNLSWQALFTQRHATPVLSSVTLDLLRRPTLSWNTAAEDTVAGFRIIQAFDSTRTDGILSGEKQTTVVSSVTPSGFSAVPSAYTQTLTVPVTQTTYYQISYFLTNHSSYVPGEPFYSKIFAVVVAKPLPVSLLAFRAARREADQPLVSLAWATASELNNQGFRIERSAQGREWNSIGFVAGAGTSTQLQSYASVDTSPAAGYYRLAQLDVDGTRTYSPVQYVPAMNGPGPTLALFPNPATNGVSVVGADPGRELDVYNATGQRVRQLPAGTSAFDATALPRGLYVVRQDGHQAKLLLQ